MYVRSWPVALLHAQQQTGAQGSVNGNYLGDTGRSWGKRVSFQLNAN